MAAKFTASYSWATDDGWPGTHVHLKKSDWDDFHYRTTFNVWLSVAGQFEEIGVVKVVRLDIPPLSEGSPTVSTDLPRSFSKLPKEYVSVGQGSDYYEELVERLGLDEARHVCEALGDLALASEDRRETALNSEAVVTSLLRFVDMSTVTSTYRDLLTKGSSIREVQLSATTNSVSPDGAAAITVASLPDSTLPTSIHVIIGGNGTGKTSLLRDIAAYFAVVEPHATAPAHWEVAADNARAPTNIVAISFSAFDAPWSRGRSTRAQSERRVTVVDLDSLGAGSNEMGDTGSRPSFSAQFRALANQATAGAGSALGTFIDRLQHADAVLRTELERADGDLTAVDPDRLSSGHKVLLLSMLSVVVYTDERTLLLVDEPESHLHPPLLAAFVRGLGEHAESKDAVALISTHSPIVLREVPASCAWKVNRESEVVSVYRPDIPTLGESIGVLSRDVFGVEADRAGFYAVVEGIARRYGSLSAVPPEVRGALGDEASAYLRAIINDRNDRAQL